MRTLVVGDIHGAHKALLQVLDRSDFDPNTDRLISLGDVTDYHPESAQVVEELIAIPNLVAVKGNHDIWAADFLLDRIQHDAWIMQGGRATVLSYVHTGLYDDPRHHDFFRNQVLYFIDEGDRLYVHAGYDPKRPLCRQDAMTLCWGREFWMETGTRGLEGRPPLEIDFENVFIGHSPTPRYFPHTKPVNFGKVWNLDQGIKREGKLTIMDVETKAYWQSDPVRKLYP